MIQVTGQPRLTPPTPRASAAPPPHDLEVKPELQGIADRYNRSRSVGDYLSAVLLGAAKEEAATAAQSPLLAFSIVKNLWKAETIGPNLKTLGTLAAIPGAALSLVAGPIYGAVVAGTVVSHSLGDGLLTKDTSNDYARSVFQSSPDDKEPKTMTGYMMRNLDEFGNRKLQEGEKPHDVPLLSPLFAVTGGVLSGTIAGAVGLVAGVVAGSITTVKEMDHAFTNKNETIGERVGQFIAAPLNLVVMGPALAWSGIKESVPRGLVDGWNHGPLKPVVDTVKASAGLATAAIKEAWER